MSDKHILFHRPTPWDSAVECSTKILAKLFNQIGYKVTYLEGVLDPLNMLRRPRTAISSWQRISRVENGITIIKPTSIVPVRKFWPLNTELAMSAQYRLCHPAIDKQVLSLTDNAPDVIWTTVPGSAVAFRKMFPKAEIAFHSIDYYAAFRGKRVLPVEKNDYEVSDYIFTIGHALKEHVLSLSADFAAKTIVLGQGVRLDDYQKKLKEPADLAKLPKPRAIWVGVLAKGDPELFRAAARAIATAGGSLILIGPPADWATNLVREMPATVIALGAKPTTQVPAYLLHADMGLMLYDRSRGSVYFGQNPLKLYEYCAAGLPVLSTHHREYLQLKPPVFKVQEAIDVTAAVSEIIANASVHQSRSLAFVENKSWMSKVRQIESVLNFSGTSAQQSES